MKGLKLIFAARQKVREQRQWIARCGGDLAGYIAKYGDPGVAPLDEKGYPKIVKLTPEQAVLIQDGVPVPGQPGHYYGSHSGDGGTLIYHADASRLEQFESELRRLEEKHSVAAEYARQEDEPLSL
jgi:hypothetical protein